MALTKEQKYWKNYYQANKQKIKDRAKQWDIDHKDHKNQRQRNYRLKNHNHMLEIEQKWRDENKDKIKAIQQRYYEKNKSKICQRSNARRKNNPEKRRAENKKFLEDPKNRIIRNLRNRVWQTIIRGYKSSDTITLLGCNRETLVSHLESLFKPGMSWENYGVYGWHIDHIQPCASFDLTDPEQQKKCFHYTNLQPLWAKENLTKGASDSTSLPVDHNS